MKIFSYGKDGGAESTVWGFWLIEWKRAFSIALLCFEDGSREAYHDHAFNSISWVLRGNLMEEVRDGYTELDRKGPLYCFYYNYTPSWRPIFTYRTRMHKVTSIGRTWVLTFRGPWLDKWHEHLPATNEDITLTHGRQRIAD